MKIAKLGFVGMSGVFFVAGAVHADDGVITSAGLVLGAAPQTPGPGNIQRVGFLGLGEGGDHCIGSSRMVFQCMADGRCLGSNSYIGAGFTGVNRGGQVTDVCSYKYNSCGKKAGRNVPAGPFVTTVYCCSYGSRGAFPSRCFSGKPMGWHY